MALQVGAPMEGVKTELSGVLESIRLQEDRVSQRFTGNLRNFWLTIFLAINYSVAGTAFRPHGVDLSRTASASEAYTLSFHPACPSPRETLSSKQSIQAKLSVHRPTGHEFLKERAPVEEH